MQPPNNPPKKKFFHFVYVPSHHALPAPAIINYTIFHLRFPNSELIVQSNFVWGMECTLHRNNLWYARYFFACTKPLQVSQRPSPRVPTVLFLIMFVSDMQRQQNIQNTLTRAVSESYFISCRGAMWVGVGVRGAECRCWWFGGTD